ncbi:protein kinase [Mycobacterium intermedium]|uniref:protein kinase domain-containing protein n=1 Tax=Mycobacterium intermedium TaxID=28445 RepID=UPI00147635A1|nr:protein kinase [Mycobacterium intermedium]MCV6963673.1 protein kinase [Mycobacterium intermedium]
MADETFIEGVRSQRAPATHIEGDQAGRAEYQPLPPSLAAQGHRVIRELGAGSEARVWLCTNGNGVEVAVKVYFRAPDYKFELNSSKYRRHFSREWAVEVLQRGSDPVAGAEMHYEVMEYCADGTLEEFVAARGNSDQIATQILARLAFCLKGLQGPNAQVVHGDLKPRNVLVRNVAAVDLVLSDFGLTFDLDQRSHLSNFGHGTTAYNAPEVMRVKGAPADWWSLGMVMYTVLVGRGYYQLDDGRWLNQRAIETDLLAREVSLNAIDGLAMSAERRQRWKLLLAGLLTRDFDLRWGAAQVEAWLAGQSPAVHRPLDGSLPESGHSRPVQPFPFANVGEFTSPAALGAAMAERPEEAARMLSGKGINRLLAWLTKEVCTGDDYSELAQHNWDAEAKVVYFVARLAPTAPLTFRGHAVTAPSDLVRLAQSGDTEVVGALFDARLLGGIADDGARSGYRMIDVNWHDVVGRARDAAALRGVPFTRQVRRQVRQVALSITAIADFGSVHRYVADVMARVSAPQFAAAREVDWFVRLCSDAEAVPGSSNDALALALLIDATADIAGERGQHGRDDQAEEARRQTSTAASRLGLDLKATIAAVALAATVRVPVLIGQFVMTKTFVLKPDPNVYEASARGIRDHYLAFYLAGLIPIALMLGVFLVARRAWAGRRVAVAGGIALLIGTLVILLPAAMSKWHEAEGKAVAKLRQTPFPFAQEHYSCASWTFDAENGTHDAELWQVHLGQFADSPGQGCNRANVYRGWQFVGAYDLPDGDTFTGEIVVDTPDWTEPERATSSTSFASHHSPTDRRARMNPIDTYVNLPTTNGRVLDFSLDGAGQNGFHLR